MKSIYRIFLFTLLLFLFPLSIKASDGDLKESLQGAWFQLEKNEVKSPDFVSIVYVLDPDDQGCVLIVMEILEDAVVQGTSFSLIVAFDLTWHVEGEKVELQLATDEIYVDVDDVIIDGEPIEATPEQAEKLIDLLSDKITPWIDQLKAEDYDEMNDIVFDGDFMYFTDVHGSRYKNIKGADDE